jgi:arginase
MTALETATRSVVLIGAPSTAGAYAPGQEGVPRLLRDAGLPERLRAAGLETVDAGDTPYFRWEPDRTRPRAQHVPAVATTARAVAEATRDAIGRGNRALVVGGDCTVATGAVAGVRAAGLRPGLVYLDRHPDMNTPLTVADGALDWMGLAHLLNLEGTEPELVAALGPAPALAPGDVVLLATDPTQYSPWEHDRVTALGIRAIGWEDVAADPAAAARSALAALDTDAVVVHFDMDVLDFTDAPLSQAVLRNTGITLDAAGAALSVLLADPRVRALSLSELQPAHAVADPGAVDRLVEVVTTALAASP